MLNLRGESRYLCSELVSVLYEDSLGGVNRAVANMEEISPSEVTLLTDERLESGIPVSFRAKGHQLHGIVESSELDSELGWFVKVSLDAGSRWQARMFVPEHFFSLCASTLLDVTDAVTAPAAKLSILCKFSGDSRKRFQPTQ
jgi:hypothetical protein